MRRRLLLLVPLLAAACGSADESVEAVPGSLSSEAASPPMDPAASGSLGRGQPVRMAATDTAGAPAPGQETQPGAAGETPSALPTMIIRTGRAVVRVDTLEPAVARVRAMAARLGGYVANENITAGTDEMRQSTLELKLPAARFDEAVSGLGGFGTLESVNVEAQDVGEEFVDVTARMENARRLEARLLDLLANRTGKLEEVLTVERELARVREEIERYAGRLRYLRTRAAVSTLTVSLHEGRPVLDPGESPIADAFRSAWRNFIGFVAGFISFLGILVPLGLVLLAGWWIVRRVWKR